MSEAYPKIKLTKAVKDRIFYRHKKGFKWDKYNLGASLVLAKTQKLLVFNKEIRLSSELQKILFGYVPFGKKVIEIEFDSNYTYFCDLPRILVMQKVSFGQDTNTYLITFSEMAKILNNKTKIH